MEAEVVPCRFCEKPTPMLGTRECDNCHEVYARVRSMPTEVLRKILSSAHHGWVLKELYDRAR